MAYSYSKWTVVVKACTFGLEIRIVKDTSMCDTHCSHFQCIFPMVSSSSSAHCKTEQIITSTILWVWGVEIFKRWMFNTLKKVVSLEGAWTLNFSVN